MAVFLLTAWNPMFAAPLVLVPAFIPYRPWTLISYMFVHAGFGHIFFNMLALYFFGPQVELRLGSRSFLGLYLVSGMGAPSSPSSRRTPTSSARRARCSA